MLEREAWRFINNRRQVPRQYHQSGRKGITVEELSQRSRSMGGRMLEVDPQ